MNAIRGSERAVHEAAVDVSWPVDPQLVRKGSSRRRGRGQIVFELAMDGGVVAVTP